MAGSAAPSLVAPRHLWQPAYDRTDGPAVAGFAESLGLRLDPEQRLVLDVMYARRRNRWAALECALVAPRQNLKTFVFEVACLADLFLFGGPSQLIIWTAHLFPTANEAFIDLKAMIDRHDFLAARVKRITEAAGNQGIELVDGTRLKFLARSKSGGRGFSGSKIYLDESFALAPAEVGSLLPTLSAQPDPQVVYGSSAGRLDSAVLRELRDRGRAGDDPSLAYIEWAAEPGECAEQDCVHSLGARGCILDDRRRWRQANTALGVRIGEDFIAAERRALPPREFMRERLGWWEDPPTGDEDDPLANWPNLADPTAKPAGPLWLGIDVAPNMASTAIAVSDGYTVEIVEERSGSSWAPAKVAELLERHSFGAWGLVKGSPAEALVPDLPDGVTLLGAADTTSACARLARDVADGAIRHRDDPRLNAAVSGAVRKFAGDGWRWTRVGSSTPIVSLYAATVAHWLASTSTAPLTTEQLLKSFG